MTWPIDDDELGPVRGTGRKLLLRPSGAAPVALSCIAAAALVWISRPPLSGPQSSAVELRYYFHRDGLRGRIVSVTELIYVAGVSLLVLATSFLILRLLSRLIASRFYRRPKGRPVDLGRRAALLTPAGVAATAAMALGWQRRMASIWVRTWGNRLVREKTRTGFSSPRLERSRRWPCRQLS